MKTHLWILVGTSIFVWVGMTQSLTASETRVWTDTRGKTLEASFVRLDGEEIVLQRTNGEVVQFPLERLAAEDQKLARELKPVEISASNVPATGITGFPYPSGMHGTAARQIDVLVAQGIVKEGNKLRKANGQAPLKGFNPAANDEQFVRRVYLDVIGRIPNFEETSDFLRDNDPQKRTKLIDQLLASDGYASHMFNYLAEMLRVKHAFNNVRADDYVNWLRTQVATNRPWDQMVKAMLTASGKMWTDQPDKGAAGYLLRDSGMPLDNLANTLSIFIATDVACAQCHDHPFADWTQMQFYEMAAFFGATTTRNRSNANRPLLEEVYKMVEASGQDITRLRNGIGNFVNVNGNEVQDGDKVTLKLPHDYKYSDAKPGDLVKPKFVMWTPKDKSNPAYEQNLESPQELRQAFANWMTHPDHPRFAMTIANRLWKRAFGAGVAQPVTNIDDPELSSNPELLKFLAEAMKKVKFDLKEFQRIVLNTRAYQSEATTEDVPMGVPYFFQGPLLRRMTGEQAWDSYMTLVLGRPEEYKAPLSDLYGRTVDLNLKNPNLKPQDVLIKYSAFTEMNNKLNALMGGGLDAAGDDSMMMMGGGRGTPAKESAEPKADGPGKFLKYGNWRLLRASELPQPEGGGHFLAEFGQSPRELIDGGSTVGSVPQVLMMMNGNAQKMLTDRKSLIFRTMDKVPGQNEKVETLFLSVMNRRPTMREKDIAKRELTASGEDAYAHIIWALINTREFIFIQ